jgi:predicted nucleic acid-binding protein
MNFALVDTSFLVAIYNRSDFHHSRCLRVYDALDQPLASCEAVITECAHLLSRVHGASEAILASIEQGILEIPFQLNKSAGKVQAIQYKYRDTPADFADACLVQMADELDTGDILTLDSDFKHYRWRRNRSFRLLVPLDDWIGA